VRDRIIYSHEVVNMLSTGMVHKASIGQAPTYIADMLTPFSSVQSLSNQRSATNDYIVPRTNRIASLARGLSQSPRLKLGTAADQTENINLFHWQFQTLPQNIFISVCLWLWYTCWLTSVMRHRSDCRGRNRNNCCICICICIKISDLAWPWRS